MNVILRFLSELVRRGAATSEVAQRWRQIEDGNQFWSEIAEPLEDIVERLRQPFRLSGDHQDAENVYEWYEVDSEHGYGLNISRMHTDPIRLPTNPTRFVIAGSLPDTDQFGAILAAHLRCTCYQGTVNYLGADAFRFDPHRVFTYEPEPHPPQIQDDEH